MILSLQCQTVDIDIQTLSLQLASGSACLTSSLQRGTLQRVTEPYANTLCLQHHLLHSPPLEEAPHASRLKTAPSAKGGIAQPLCGLIEGLFPSSIVSLYSIHLDLTNSLFSLTVKNLRERITLWVSLVPGTLPDSEWRFKKRFIY